MAKRRDYAAEYRRRIAGTAPGSAARGRARGHPAGEYRRRVAGVSGPEARARRAGHRGRADFLRYIRPGDRVTLSVHVAKIERDAFGRYRLEKTVVPWRESRPERRFTVRRVDDGKLRDLIRAEMERGGVLTPSPSLDQRRLLRRPIDADIRTARMPMSRRRARAPVEA
jgi:hypothetical protein